MSLHFLALALVIAAASAIADFRTGHIPNRLTLLGLAAAVLGHFLQGTLHRGLGEGVEQAGLSLLGALLCALAPLLMRWNGAMGGGDVKLFAALGAALLPLQGLEAETYGLLAAMLLAPAKLAWEGTLFRTLGRTLVLVLNPLRKKENKKALPAEMKTWFRLGPAVLLGTIATCFVHYFAIEARP